MQRINPIMALGCILFSMILVIGCTTTSQDSIMILNDSLMKNNKVIIAAWLIYGATRSEWQEKIFFKTYSDDTKYRYTFSEEYEAREKMAEFWILLQTKKESIPNKYLDKLVKIHQVGFLKDYVWEYYHDPSWQAEPEGLLKEDFKSWSSLNLKNHKAETLVTFQNQ